jgi:hypothetical protein
MLLHHYMWWRIGEDYDGFERIRTSTCLPFKSKLNFCFFWLIPMGYINWWFPNGVYYIVDEWGRWFPDSVLNATQDGILVLRKCISFWLEGSV